MKILLDSSAPAPLAYSLRFHEVVRTGQLGWQSLEDGILLDIAEREGFQVLITCEQSIPHQQNMRERKIAVLVLSSNRWPLVKRVAPQIATLVEFLQRGQVRRLDVLSP